MQRVFVSIFFLILSSLSSELFAQIDAALILGKRGSELESRLAFGSYLKFGFPINQADEVSAELSLLRWDELDAGYMSGKIGYVYTLNREGYGWFVEPQLGYVFVGSDPSYENYMGEGNFKGGVGTLNFGYRFGQSKFKADLALRYEQVITTTVGSISSVGIRFAVSIGFGRGRSQD